MTIERECTGEVRAYLNKVSELDGQRMEKVFHNNTKQQGGAGEWLTRTAGTWRDKLQPSKHRFRQLVTLSDNGVV